MGIATAAVVIIMLAFNFFSESGTGGGMITTLLTDIVTGVKVLFTFK
ncbi:hypothetical protein [Gracilibacillus xinjiangensis]|uniref:Uncharacterized protein n=1 Tax=Gracilibacillus xinjiangensis TaxID=1193282 RepID=A0ABV8WTB8_9BACI